MKHLLTFACLFFAVQLLYSQEDKLYGEVEIVRLQLPISTEDTGRSVEVLTAEEITNAPVTTLGELLRFLPGVTTTSRGGFGVQDDFSMRGSTFSQILIVIDGVRWNEPLTAHLNSSLPIPIHEIERIEVIRGAASALYGADAVGGLIHIHTKTATANQTTKDFSTTGSAFYGEQNLLDTDFAARTTIGIVQLSAAYKQTSSNGEKFINPNYSAGISDSEDYTTDFMIRDFTLAASVKASNQLSFFGRYANDKRDYNAKYFYTGSSYDESVEDNKFNFIQLGSKYANENSTTHFTASYRNGTDVFVFNPLFPSNEHTTDRYLAILGHERTLSNSDKIAFGIQHDDIAIESTDRGDHKQTITEAYATYFKEWKTFGLVTSLRGGNNSDSGFQLTPQLSVSYQRPKTIYRASIGSAVRNADFTEKYVSFNLPQVAPMRNIGNPNLEVEQSVTGDIGADIQLTNQLRYSVTGFLRTSSQLIDYVAVNADDVDTYTNLIAGETYMQATNIGEGKSYGVEQELRYTKNWTEQQAVQMQLSHQYIYTTLSENVVSKYLNSHPRNQANFNISGQAGLFQFSINNSYTYRNRNDLESVVGAAKKQYFLTHISAGYDVNQSLHLKLRANNLFNENYQEILGARMPGQWFSAGVQWTVE